MICFKEILCIVENVKINHSYLHGMQYGGNVHGGNGGVTDDFVHLPSITTYWLPWKHNQVI